MHRVQNVKYNRNITVSFYPISGTLLVPLSLLPVYLISHRCILVAPEFSLSFPLQRYIYHSVDKKTVKTSVVQSQTSSEFQFTLEFQSNLVWSRNIHWISINTLITYNFNNV